LLIHCYTLFLLAYAIQEAEQDIQEHAIQEAEQDLLTLNTSYLFFKQGQNNAHKTCYNCIDLKLNTRMYL